VGSAVRTRALAHIDDADCRLDRDGHFERAGTQ
jgi:hypothetical protein